MVQSGQARRIYQTKTVVARDQAATYVAARNLRNQQQVTGNPIASDSAAPYFVPSLGNRNHTFVENQCVQVMVAAQATTKQPQPQQEDELPRQQYVVHQDFAFNS